MARDKKIAFSVAAVALAVSASVIAVHKNPKSTYVSHVTAVPAAPVTTKVVPITVAARKLTANSQPFTLAVVGDSTGYGTDRWVYRYAHDLRRPVTFHSWNLTTNRYDPPETIAGTGAPVVIWNASATGKDAAYSTDQAAAMVPAPPDLTIINHGHNQTVTNAASQVERLLGLLRGTWPNSAFAVIEQNPETAKTAADQSARVHAIATMGRAEQVTVIDVYDAFEHTGRPDSLLIDDRHPTSEGSILFEQTVIAALFTAAA